MDRGLAFLDGPLLLPRTIRATSHSTVGLDPETAVTYFLEALDSSEKEVAGQIEEALSVDATAGVDEGKDRDGKERRQGLGLGRKRPRFSMLPNKRNRESSGTNLTLNADHIVDPDEYFAAIERNDRAEKELKKLRGDVTAEPAMDNILRSKRQRRPGLLQRRTSLNHFSQELADSANTLILPREVDESRKLSLPKSSVHAKYNSSLMETTGSRLPAATELECVVAAKENRTDIIVDKLSSSCEVLYDQEDVALLEECLKFKPMVVDKLQLPITPPDTPPYTQTKASVQRKPLAAISFLQKQNIQKDTLADPYTWLLDDAPHIGEPLSSMRNGVAVPSINMNDWCASPGKSGSKCSVDKILKSQITLDMNINDSITPFTKRTSKLHTGGTLVSSNTEGADNPSCEISLDECPTDTSLTSILKSAKDKVNIPLETNAQMLTSFSSGVLASDSLTGARAHFSVLSAVDSCAREPSSATEHEVMNANLRLASTEQPTKPVTSMNGTLASFRENMSMPSSNGLKSSRISSLRDDDPSTPSNSTRRLSLSMILKSQTIKKCDKPPGNISYRSVAKLMDNSGRSDHDSVAGSVGKQSLSNEKDNDKRFEVVTQNMDARQQNDNDKNFEVVTQDMDAHAQNDNDERFGVATQNMDAHPQNDNDKSFEVVTQNKHAHPQNDNDRRSEVVTQNMKACPQNDNDKRFEIVSQNMDAHLINDNDKSFEVVTQTQNMEAHPQNDTDKRFEVVTQNMDAHPQNDNDNSFKVATQNMNAFPRNDINRRSEVVTQNMVACPQNDTVKRFVTPKMEAHPQNVDEALHDESERTEFPEDPLRLNMRADATVDGHPESSSITEHIESQTTSRFPNERAPQQSKRRKSRGKSLAGVGTRWEAGLRRSTRERFRPLEHWRGERLLYGRLHQSLATVIGMKYSSPGAHNLKVKSFVSPVHAELVERAALH